MNIFEKLSNISNEIGNVNKNLEVGFGQSKYKAVGEADVLKAVKELEKKYGVYSYPAKRQIIESSMIESINNKGEVKKNLFERIETVYRFVNIEEPSEYIEITTYGDGIDSQDKSVGKAMTYADKYALLKAYKIVTGDDPDQHASEELKGKVTNQPKAAKQEEPSNPNQSLIDKVTYYWNNPGEIDVKAIVNEVRAGKRLPDCTQAQLNRMIRLIEEAQNGEQ